MTPIEIEVELDRLEESHRGDSPFSRDKARVEVLESSGVFAVLGEAMVACDHGYHTISHELEAMWKACGISPVFAVSEPYEMFGILCEAFRVPPVFCEILLPSVNAPDVWQPPSPQLASAVLREAAIFHEQFDVSHWFQLMAQVSVWPLPAHELLMAYHEANEGCADATRNLHPDATAFRVRLGATGDWHERPL